MSAELTEQQQKLMYYASRSEGICTTVLVTSKIGQQMKPLRGDCIRYRTMSCMKRRCLGSREIEFGINL